MSSPRPAVRPAAAALLLAGAALLPGCLILPAVARTRTGALLREDRVQAIAPGRTSAAEITEWLGPPLAVAREPEGVLPVPDVVYRRSGAFEVSASSLFDKFARDEVGAGDVVYFYREHEVATIGSGVVLVFGNKGGLTGSSHDEHREDRLWVLVDGETGIVKARVHERDLPPGRKVSPESEEDP